MKIMAGSCLQSQVSNPDLYVPRQMRFCQITNVGWFSFLNRKESASNAKGPKLGWNTSGRCIQDWQ
jgi:hypothetical protein